MKGFSSSALADLSWATVLTAAIGLGMEYLPLGQLVLTPFLALPLGYVAMRRGSVDAFVGAVIAGVLVWLGSEPGLAMLVFALAAGVGIALGNALRARWSFASTVGLTAGVGVAVSLAWGLALWLVMGVTWTHVQQAFVQAVQDSSSLYTQMGVSQATVTSMVDQARHMVSIAPYLAPGLLGAASILLVSCSAGLAYLIFPRLGSRTRSPLSLSRFRMHWSLAYVSIVGLALLLFARGSGEWQSVLRYAGIDLLLVSQTLFFLQGLAVVHWFAVSRRWGRGARGLSYAVAVVFFQFTGLAGLFDTWVDYRKRFAPKGSRSGPTSSNY